MRTEEVPYLANIKDRVALEKLERRILARADSFRFHGETGRSGGAGTRERSRTALRSDANHLFHRPRNDSATRKLGLSAWRGSMFAWMTRNAGDVTSYFCLPPNGVVELGARVEV